MKGKSSEWGVPWVWRVNLLLSYFSKGLINHVGVCLWQSFISSRTMFLGLERWLSSWEGLLLLQGTQAQLPSPLSVAHNYLTFSSRWCDSISWLPWAPAHKWHPLTHTCMHKQKCLKAYYYLAWHPLVGITEIMFVLYNIIAGSCTSQFNLEMWLVWELRFKITFIWINLNSHGWLVVTILDGTDIMNRFLPNAVSDWKKCCMVV